MKQHMCSICQDRSNKSYYIIHIFLDKWAKSMWWGEIRWDFFFQKIGLKGVSIHIYVSIHIPSECSDWEFNPHPHHFSPLSVSLPGNMLVVMPWAKNVCNILQKALFYMYYPFISVWGETVQSETHNTICVAKAARSIHTILYCMSHFPHWIPPAWAECQCRALWHLITAISTYHPPLQIFLDVTLLKHFSTSLFFVTTHNSILFLDLSEGQTPVYLKTYLNHVCFFWHSSTKENCS